MSSADAAEKSSPPYVPFSTFLNFVERLKSTSTPSKIDNSIMPNLAGGVRGQVRSALRFLCLTDSDDHVTTIFRELIQAHGTDSWGPALAAVINAAYAPILNGLDLSGATPALLLNKFRVAGVTGQMAEKSIRFLLAALESAGQSFSPHLASRGALSSSKTVRRPGKPRGESSRGKEHEQDEELEPVTASPPSPGVRSFTFPVPGEPDIKVEVPEQIDDPDVWAMVDATLRSYIKLNAKAKGGNAHRLGGDP
jgi:hypothetical protein